MNRTIEEYGATQSQSIILKIREAQIRQLYRQSWVGLVGVIVVGISICIALWRFLSPWKLVLWICILTVITIMRGILTFSFRIFAPVGGDIAKWGKWHVVGTTASGFMWGLPSFFLWPDSYPEYYLVWALCILPLSASAVSTYYTWKPSYISFLLLSAGPVSLRFLSEGGLVYIVLGLLTLFFIAVLVQAGSLIHIASLRTMSVGFRNEALSSFLVEEKAKQEELTRQLQQAHEKLHKISLTDELTGLWNRRYLNDTIQVDVAKVLRNYRNLCQGLGESHSGNTDIVFTMVDFDHFKVVNDTHGHAAGDQVLKQMSHLLTESCRDTDTTIRWGGEEFLVVSEDARRGNYTVLAERIRQAVETHEFDIGKESPLHLTCSIGTAVFPFLTDFPEALSWDEVVDMADACLYAAKRSGRNAWVAITSTDLTSSDDLTPDLAKHLPGLIQDGKLEMKTSLKEDAVVCWPD